MLARSLYVISDLHIGGAPAANGGVGFQMCPPTARRSLARFLHATRALHGKGAAELVINGDFVDFLAVGRSAEETPCDPFTPDQAEAVRKLRQVIATADDGAPDGERVFEALQAWVSSGHALTILLGNHDLELALPQVRAVLIDLLCAGGGGRVQFLYDGEAYARDGVLIEHGNRYDAWNAVSHGSLRAFRAAATRRESAEFVPPPGSRLVAEVMNPLKARYRFVDLLKPENETVVPILAALEPDQLWRVTSIAKLAAQAALRRARPGRVPRGEAFTADGGVQQVKSELAPADLEDPRAGERIQRVLTEMSAQWGEPRPARGHAVVSSGPAVADAQSSGMAMMLRTGAVVPDARYHLLRKAFMLVAETLDRTFDTTAEAPQYLEAARRLAASGNGVVVFGHTHLPKRVSLGGSNVYLNSGTWCPLVRLPAGIYDGTLSDAEAFEVLRTLVADLAENRTDRWCEPQRTVVRINVSDAGTEAELLRFTDADNLEAVEGML